jgi:hypothetical protein
MEAIQIGLLVVLGIVFTISSWAMVEDYFTEEQF